MEALVYEDIPEASARLERLKVALLAFLGVSATAPAITAILVPVDLSSSSSLSPLGSAKLARRTSAEERLRQACESRVQLRRWLQHDIGVSMDLWIVAAVAPRDNSQLSTLVSWQNDRHKSPLRHADAISLSLQDVALLWNDRRSQPPVFTKLLLSHQSLLLNITCCFGEGGHYRVTDAAVFAPLRAKHMAKGRTCAVAFYSAWLPLASTSRGLARLQQQFRDVARDILLPTQLPLCCCYGGKVGSLQENLVPVSFPHVTRMQELEAKSNPSPLVSSTSTTTTNAAAALLSTRSLRDVFSLVGVLLGNPLVNYYGEAMSFSSSVQKRRRAAGFVYSASVMEVKPPCTRGTNKGVKRTRIMSGSVTGDGKRKQGRMEKEDVEKSAMMPAPVEEEEELPWCEDIRG